MARFCAELIRVVLQVVLRAIASSACGRLGSVYMSSSSGLVSHACLVSVRHARGVFPFQFASFQAHLT